jgi:hypothetical protein
MRAEYAVQAIGPRRSGAVAFALPAWAHHSRQLRRHVGCGGCRHGSALARPAFLIYLEVKRPAGDATLARSHHVLGSKLESSPITSKWRHDQARCHHLRDGSNGCLLGFLKAKDGAVKDWDGGNAPPPTDF